MVADLCWTLPGGFAYKEGTQGFDKPGGLAGSAHVLDDPGEWVEVGADQADDEIVVIFIQAVAGQADVVGVVFAAVGAADAGVFHEDFTLFFVVELSKVASAPERIPDGPGPFGIEDVALRTVDEGFVQVGFVAGGVGATEHGEVGAMVEVCEGRAAEEVAGFVDKGVRRFGGDGDSDAIGVVCVGVQGSAQAAVLDGFDEGSCVRAVSEGLKLDKEAAVADLGLAVFGSAFFTEVEGFGVLWVVLHGLGISWGVDRLFFGCVARPRFVAFPAFGEILF